MDWLMKTSVLLLLLVVQVLKVQATTLDWYQAGELPTTTGRGEVGNISGLTGSFLGVHNGALILAGGEGLNLPPGPDFRSEPASKNYYDTIWVATREQGSDVNDDDEITADERPLRWHSAQQTLPGGRAHGASASHAMGVIIIGGTDGASGYSDAHLLRWNVTTRQVERLALPAMPSVAVKGGAAIIRDTLYVMAGSHGESVEGTLYAFDLSRIQTEVGGNPLAINGVVQIIDSHDASGKPVKSWQQLPSLPEMKGKTMSRAPMMVVAQNDGRVDQLYVIMGPRSLGL